MEFEFSKIDEFFVDIIVSLKLFLFEMIMIEMIIRWVNNNRRTYWISSHFSCYNNLIFKYIFRIYRSSRYKFGGIKQNFISKPSVISRQSQQSKELTRLSELWPRWRGKERRETEERERERLQKHTRNTRRTNDPALSHATFFGVARVSSLSTKSSFARMRAPMPSESRWRVQKGPPASARSLSRLLTGVRVPLNAPARLPSSPPSNFSPPIRKRVYDAQFRPNFQSDSLSSSLNSDLSISRFN